MIKVLFVCTGNICRSPTAEGLFNHRMKAAQLQDHFLGDSAGMIAFHVGEPPDARSAQTAAAKGISLAGQSARQMKRADLNDFDYLIAMDRGHHAQILDLAGDHLPGKLFLLRQFENDPSDLDVPDPYYGNQDGFERTYAIIDNAMQGFINYLLKNHMA